ncbi:hypothetical protein ACODT5_00135 [Streptomyces sp. 5.8]|uniref:hypothetical protein n=1 Tax=Streptomyces sp. 5.8 TaxID=3406571 RepID=UPI003BB522BA
MVQLTADLARNPPLHERIRLPEQRLHRLENLDDPRVQGQRRAVVACPEGLAVLGVGEYLIRAEREVVLVFTTCLVEKAGVIHRRSALYYL